MSELLLIEAVKADDMTGVKDLIESGADVNQQDEQQWTPLNWAAGKGNLAMVSLLVEKGADFSKVGRDQRTPYMIALAAGHAEVVKFLRQAEEQGDIPKRPARNYCRAYHLSDFRRFPGWAENKSHPQPNSGNGNGAASKNGEHEFTGDEIVFLHQDYTVTKSMWHDEDVIFNQVTPEWSEFCATKLDFKVPDDLDFIVSAKDASPVESS